MPALKRFKTKYPGVYVMHGTSIANGRPEEIFYIRYRINGKQVEEKAGRQYQDDMTPAKASRIRASRIEGGELPNRDRRVKAAQEAHSQQNRWTLDRLFDEFVQHKAHLKSLRDDKSRYENHIRPVLGMKEPSELSPFDFDRIRISLGKNHKPATVKQVLVLLQRIVNFGANSGLCDRLSFKIEMPKVNNIKTEDLSPAQLERLLGVLDVHPDRQAANIMKLALYTGMRRTEMLRLKWEHIDFDRGFIRIVNPKGGKDEVIPLNDAARQVLTEHPKTDSFYVFPGKYGDERNNVAKALKKIKQAAGLPKDFRPLHGLRHVYASTLASSGLVDLYTLQKLLTHKSPQMTQRYAHLRDDALKRASNLAGELIQKAAKQADKDSTSQSA